MIGQRETPNIQVSIGQELRLYQAYVTTAPANLDAPATFTLHTGPLSDVSGMAADSITFDAVSSKAPARLVLVDEDEIECQRARYHEGRHLFRAADPVLYGLDTLQSWLWNRIEAR
jgi:hypothetical protein